MNFGKHIVSALAGLGLMAAALASTTNTAEAGTSGCNREVINGCEYFTSGRAGQCDQSCAGTGVSINHWLGDFRFAGNGGSATASLFCATANGSVRSVFRDYVSSSQNSVWCPSSTPFTHQSICGSNDCDTRNAR